MTATPPTYDHLIQENQALRTRLAETERLLAERTAAERQGWAILDTLAVGVLLLDAEGHYTFANQRAASMMFQLTPDELVGKTLFDVLPPEVASAHHERNRQLIAAQATETDEATFTLPVGTRTFLITEQVLANAEGAGRLLLSSSLDITERIQAEIALRESQQNLAALIENTDGSIWSVDPQYQLIVGNARYHHDVHAALGRQLAPGECVLAPELPQSALDEWQAYYDRALGHGPFSVEATTRFRVEPRTIEYRLNPIRTPGGQIAGVTIFGRDITVHKQAEATIRGLAERLELATRAAGIGVWDWDIPKNELVWDERMYALYGVTREAFTGAYEAWLQGLHPEDRAASDANSAAARRGERPYDTQFRVVWPDGSIRVLKAAGDVVWDTDGTPLRMIGVNYDITELTQAVADLRASEARYRLLAEHSTDVIWTLDLASFRFTYVSPSVERLRGYTVEEVLAQPTEAALTPASNQVIASQLGPRIAAFLAGDESARSLTTEVDQPRKGGSIVPTEVVTTLLTDAEGRVTAVLGVSRDITARKQAELALRQLNETLEQHVAARTAELARANDELVRAVRLKDEFLATMSHELRTPLNIILSRLELLLEEFDGPLTPRQSASLRRIEASGRHLLALIEDILNFSSLEAGTLSLSLTAVDVALVCRHSRQQVATSVTQKRLTLTTTLDAQVTTVWADERWLTQILVNLLSNAVKFTPEGGRDRPGGARRCGAADRDVDGLGYGHRDRARGPGPPVPALRAARRGAQSAV